VVAIIVAPILAIVLCSTAPANLNIDRIMLFAVAAPALSCAFGFAAGALMAAAHNVFAQEQRRAVYRFSKSEAPEVPEAPFVSAA
jgi:hypothetical protein